MRALFMKDIVILMFFLSAGLTGLTLVAVELGYDKAFVIPTLRIPEEMVGFWIAFGVLLGWALGATDKLRGLAGYVKHRGLASSGLFWKQMALGFLTLITMTVLPWFIVAMLGKGHFDGDFMGLGVRWIQASTIALPCFAAGVLCSKLPVYWAFRLALTAPLLYWIVGPDPDRFIEGKLLVAPVQYALTNTFMAMAMLAGAFLADRSGQDMDHPVPKAAMLPLFFVLIGSGWTIHTFITEATLEVLAAQNRRYLAQRTDGTLALAENHYNLDRGRSEPWEVDPQTHERIVPNSQLRPLQYKWNPNSKYFQSQGSRNHRAGPGIPIRKGCSGHCLDTQLWHPAATQSPWIWKHHQFYDLE